MSLHIWCESFNFPINIDAYTINIDIKEHRCLCHNDMKFVNKHGHSTNTQSIDLYFHWTIQPELSVQRHLSLFGGLIPEAS